MSRARRFMPAAKRLLQRQQRRHVEQVRLPSMCVPASRSVRATYSLPSALDVRNTPSTSPFGSATKPSRETAIFNTHFFLLPLRQPWLFLGLGMICRAGMPMSILDLYKTTTNDGSPRRHGPRQGTRGTGQHQSYRHSHLGDISPEAFEETSLRGGSVPLFPWRSSLDNAPPSPTSALWRSARMCCGWHWPPRNPIGRAPRFCAAA